MLVVWIMCKVEKNVYVIKKKIVVVGIWLYTKFKKNKKDLWNLCFQICYRLIIIFVTIETCH